MIVWEKTGEDALKITNGTNWPFHYFGDDTVIGVKLSTSSVNYVCFKITWLYKTFLFSLFVFFIKMCTALVLNSLL